MKFKENHIPWNKGKKGVQKNHNISGLTPGWNKGLKMSDEHRKNISLSQRQEKHHNWGKSLSKEIREKISQSLKGHSCYKDKERGKKISKANKGKRFSEETRERMSLSKRGISTASWTPKGEKSHLWRGGITPKNQLIRSSLEYKNWRKMIFERDNYTCVNCGDDSGGNLEADHIKPFSIFPELRFLLTNGRTLCKKCHKNTDTYLIKSRWAKKEDFNSH